MLGIHKKNSKKYNKGNLLIYSIYEFSKIKNNLLLINKKGEFVINNYIIAEFDIKKDNQKIRIINSYEQARRENSYIEYKKENNSNENEQIIKIKFKVNKDNEEINCFSGNEDINKNNIKIILESHIVIYWKWFNQLQKLNIQLILVTFLVTHLEISGKLFNE